MAAALRGSTRPLRPGDGIAARENRPRRPRSETTDRQGGRRELWVLGLATLATSFAGCLAVAGIDGDYALGAAGSGGVGASAVAGGTTPTTSSGAQAGSGAQGTAGSGAGPVGGSGGATSTGGAIATGGSGGTGGTGAQGGSGGSGGSGPVASVPCRGAGTCDGGQLCCLTGSMVAVGCVSPGDCAGVLAECDEPTDCPADEPICCGSWSGSVWTAIRCAASCSAVSDRIMCGNDPSNCPGTACNQSGALPGYYWCS